VTPIASVPWQARFALAVLATIMYSAIVAATFQWGSAEMQATLSGAAIPIMQQAYQFFFGSSSGSEKKDDTIARQGEQLANSTPIAPASIAMLTGTLAGGTAPPEPPALI
jgi:hypothetical protein